jgi:predicted DNA-binding ribbon-helix-helix protein
MSVVKKRSVSIRGHRTSFSVEDEFLAVLADMAAAGDQSLASVVIDIDEKRERGTNLSSALRLAALNWVRKQGH